MVYDVDIPEKTTQIIADIYDQNIRSVNTDLDTFRSEFSIVHKYKKEDLKDLRQNLRLLSARPESGIA